MVLFQDFLIGARRRGGGLEESRKTTPNLDVEGSTQRKWAEVWTIAGCCPDFHKQNSSQLSSSLNLCKPGFLNIKTSSILSKLLTTSLLWGHFYLLTFHNDGIPISEWNLPGETQPLSCCYVSGTMWGFRSGPG